MSHASPCAWRLASLAVCVAPCGREHRTQGRSASSPAGPGSWILPQAVGRDPGTGSPGVEPPQWVALSPPSPGLLGKQQEALTRASGERPGQVAVMRAVLPGT